MSNIRIAATMQPGVDVSGNAYFKAALPMGVLFEKSLNPAEMEPARVALEEKYRALVETLRLMRPTLKERNVLQNWLFGDAIITFERETADTLMFVDKLSDELARDVNYSKTMIDLCRRLREHFPDRTQLDLDLPFYEYHRNGFDLTLAQAAHTRKRRTKQK